jgi:hypothetical protein
LFEGECRRPFRCGFRDASAPDDASDACAPPPLLESALTEELAGVISLNYFGEKVL